MINGKKVLAIIPARAGSKRVKNKNSKEFGSKPLISWTLDAAKKSNYIDKLFVSTDSKKIQTIAEESDVSATPLRSEESSSDTATSIQVVLEVLNTHNDYDIILLLQPTSPFRTTEDIDMALELYFEKKAISIVSVCEAQCHPSWVAPIGSDLKMDKLVKGLQEKRSQDLEKHYMLNGAVYIIGTADFLKNKQFYLKTGTYSFIMSRGHSMDIDTEEDFEIAKNSL